MEIIVQKFGGTSVGSLERMAHVANLIEKQYQTNQALIVVVSAMSGETNRLIDLVKDTSRLYDNKEYDSIVATGEQVSSGLLALLLQEKGLKARSWMGWQIPIITTDIHKNAQILEIKKEKILEKLDKGEVAIVSGFQGLSSQNRTTTLGRSGSDTTAVALAAAFGAKRCDIYTDVDGIYTTDPRIVSKAKKIKNIAYEEMLELASQGAKVLQPRSVGIAMKYNVPIRVLSTFDKRLQASVNLDENNVGTYVVGEDKILEKNAVSGIAYSRNEAKITLRRVADRPGVAATIFSEMAAAGINVDMIVQNTAIDERVTDLTFTVERQDLDRCIELLEERRAELGYVALYSDTNVVKLSIIGIGMRSNAGVAEQMFRTLYEKGINIQVISTSEIKVSVLISEEYLELAIRSLHTAYNLDAKEENSFA